MSEELVPSCCGSSLSQHRVSVGKVSRHFPETILRHKRQQLQRGTARSLLTEFPLAHQTCGCVKVPGKHRLARILPQPDFADSAPVQSPRSERGTSRRTPSSSAWTSRPHPPCRALSHAQRPARRYGIAWSSQITSLIVPFASIALRATSSSPTISSASACVLLAYVRDEWLNRPIAGGSRSTARWGPFRPAAHQCRTTP